MLVAACSTLMTRPTTRLTTSVGKASNKAVVNKSRPIPITSGVDTGAPLRDAATRSSEAQTQSSRHEMPAVRQDEQKNLERCGDHDGGHHHHAHRHEHGRYDEIHQQKGDVD